MSDKPKMTAIEQRYQEFYKDLPESMQVEARAHSCLARIAYTQGYADGVNETLPALNQEPVIMNQQEIDAQRTESGLGGPDNGGWHE